MPLTDRLFNALRKTRTSLTQAFQTLARRRISPETLEELEELLLAADMGFEVVEAVNDTLLKTRPPNPSLAVREILLERLSDSQLAYELPAGPTVMMVVGVNGTGKTTSVAKLAAYYRRQGRKVILVAADTYRAAAVEQLRIWSERLKLRLVCNEHSADPAAVLYDGLQAMLAGDYDLAIVDTAGRLHTYDNLMVELNKMYDVVRKRFAQLQISSLITIDANLGQNSILQASQFARRVPLDGAILTKFDGTAKGGMVFPLYRELAIPTAFVGIGEHLDDLYQFDANQYVESLFEVD